MDYTQIIIQHWESFFQSNIIFDELRYIGWALVLLLTLLCTAVQSVFDAAYTALNFTSSDIFTSFLDSRFQLVYSVMLSASFLILGLIYIFSDKKPPVLRNLLVGLAIICVGPEMVTMLNDGVISSKNEMVTGSFAVETVYSNIIDLKAVSNNGWDFNSTLANTLSGDTFAILALNPSSKVKASGCTTDLAKQVFNHFMDVDDNGQMTWSEIGSKGMFDIFDPPYYYRYDIHFFQIYLLLIIDALVFIFASYAVVRMTWEIITTRVIAVFTSMELSSGQKTMKAIEYFFNAYIVLLGIPILLKLFLLWQQYVNLNFSNPFARCFLIVFAGLVVIDGPNVIEKIFGYDMGMSQGAMKIMSFVRMAQQARMQHSLSSQHRNNAHSNSAREARQAAAYKASNNTSRNGAASEPNINGKGNTAEGTKSGAGSQNNNQNIKEPDNGGNGTYQNNSGDDISAGMNQSFNQDTADVSGGAASEPDVGTNSMGSTFNNDGLNTSSNVNEPNVNESDSNNGAQNNSSAILSHNEASSTINQPNSNQDSSIAQSDQSNNINDSNTENGQSGGINAFSSNSISGNQIDQPSISNSSSDSIAQSDHNSNVIDNNSGNEQPGSKNPISSNNVQDAHDNQPNNVSKNSITQPSTQPEKTNSINTMSYIGNNQENSGKLSSNGQSGINTNTPDAPKVNTVSSLAPNQGKIPVVNNTTINSGKAGVNANNATHVQVPKSENHFIGKRFNLNNINKDRKEK